MIEKSPIRRIDKNGIPVFSERQKTKDRNLIIGVMADSIASRKRCGFAGVRKIYWNAVSLQCLTNANVA